jgi:hypothetical protein
MTTTYATSQAMGMANANAVARLRHSFHVCAAPAGEWSGISPISALLETTDRKPGRYRRTLVSHT